MGKFQTRRVFVSNWGYFFTKNSMNVLNLKEDESGNIKGSSFL
jgi:hypothetical protein